MAEEKKDETKEEVKEEVVAIDPNDRYSRQEDLMPRAATKELKVTIIGVGAVGRQVALQLASIGVMHLRIIDHDTVEAHNITTQGFYTRDIGRPKVEVVAETIKLIDPEITVEAIQEKYKPKQDIDPVVFMCVDSIAVREQIWKSCRNFCDLLIDGRMLGEVMRILTADSPEAMTEYGNSLFAPSEAEVGRCTAKSTIYTASICGAFMVHQLSRWLRKIPLDADLLLTLLASELQIPSETKSGKKALAGVPEAAASV